MKWKVENALNRDVERQHLNKILSEIGSRLDSVSSSAASPNDVTRIVERVVRETAGDALTSVRVRLQGDVSGEGTSNDVGSVVIDVVIDPSKVGIQDAPIDNTHYWRINGTWEPVSPAVVGISDITVPGIVVYTAQSPAFINTEIVGEAGAIVVENGDGLDFDATGILIGLPDIVPTSGGTIKTVEFDSKGRRIVEAEADTDDLPEGVANLYFTEERAQDAIGSILGDTTHISLAYDDDVPSITATLTNTNLASIAEVVPSDGDILEWQGTGSEWEVTKAPRVLHLDGGNF